MPSTINAGASSTIALAAGEYLVLDGIGTAQVVSAMPPNVDVSVRRFSVGATVGPFDVAASVRVVAGSLGAVFVDVDGPGLGDGDGQLTTAEAAAVRGAGALLPGQARVLKAFTGRSQLTGGTVNTKTPLMEVPIPDGSLADLSVRMDIEASFNWTNNANTKTWGIALGAGSASGGTVASAIDIRTLSFTTTASIADKIVIQRSAETPGRLYLVLPNNARQFGVPALSGATVGVLASALINPTATDQSLWVWGRLDTANTDQISLEHLFVQLQRGVS